MYTYSPFYNFLCVWHKKHTGVSLWQESKDGASKAIKYPGNFVYKMHTPLQKLLGGYWHSVIESSKWKVTVTYNLECWYHKEQSLTVNEPYLFVQAWILWKILKQVKYSYYQENKMHIPILRETSLKLSICMLMESSKKFFFFVSAASMVCMSHAFVCAFTPMHTSGCMAKNMAWLIFLTYIQTL